jgi:hypothetical protein
MNQEKKEKKRKAPHANALAYQASWQPPFFRSTLL